MQATNIIGIAKRSETITRFYRSFQFHRSASVKDLFDRRKKELISTVRPYTMLTWRELSVLYEAAMLLEKEGVAGSFAELGVCNGGSAGIISAVAAHNQDRHIWLFDSWEGLPDPSGDDVTVRGEKGEKGMCLASEERVRELLFKKLRLQESNIHLVKGWFDKTVPAFKREAGPIALLHVDCDWYDSVKFCFEELYDRVVPGGFVFIDDYGYWQGCKKAVDEFMQQRRLAIDFSKIDSTVVCFRKP